MFTIKKTWTCSITLTGFGTKIQSFANLCIANHCGTFAPFYLSQNELSRSLHSCCFPFIRKIGSCTIRQNEAKFSPTENPARQSSTLDFWPQNWLSTILQCLFWTFSLKYFSLRTVQKLEFHEFCSLKLWIFALKIVRFFTLVSYLDFMSLWASFYYIVNVYS